MSPPTGTFENTQFASQWSTVVSRRTKPRVLPAPFATTLADAPSTSTSAPRPPRIVYVQPTGKRPLPHDLVKCDHCGNMLKIARH
ncbi:hypothetical protein AAVH_22844 [Aphelenchoides avenae]|nr:hypothetical protein AAVH_22844 [Aphelenchus avenae]